MSVSSASMDRQKPLWQHLLPEGEEINCQDQSPLFAKLPSEMRGVIFKYALSDYRVRNVLYTAANVYKRPGFEGPSMSCTKLLRTCRAVYRETWFLPFVLKRQNHWLASEEDERAPPDYEDYDQAIMRRHLEDVTRFSGDEKVEIKNLHVFAQMYRLEDGDLATLLQIPYLHPLIVTLTIRHTDWWFWESNEPLRFEAEWISDVANSLSSSTREFRIEIESSKCETCQIDFIGRHISEHWFFKRPDGVVLFADASGTINESYCWDGTCSHENMAWWRFQDHHHIVPYYVRVITFQPLHTLRNKGGWPSERTLRESEKDEHEFARIELEGVREESLKWTSSDEEEWLVSDSESGGTVMVEHIYDEDDEYEYEHQNQDAWL